MRLDKFLSECGMGTRTEVKRLIAGGRVSVNGGIIKNPAEKIDEKNDAVLLDNEALRYAELEYYMLNKPKGVISATRDSGRSKSICVTELIKEKIRNDLFPVGRLDKDTEGLLIITNDGELSHRLLSPKRHVDKTYYVELSGTLTAAEADRIMGGIDIGDKKPTLPCEISRLSDNTCLITICEGRYHEIKRMFATAGLKVNELKRISMGPLALDAELMPGDYRELTEEEIDLLKSFDKQDA